MASEFYVVHHHFKPNMAGPWWEKVGALLGDGVAFEENVKLQMDSGFFNHSFMPTSQTGPIYCVWEAKDGKTEADLQEFIDGPDGVNFGLSAMNNNIMKLDLELTGGQTPYERKF